ncbi:MAG: hypothetical protein V1724_03765 [Chloroflexota bacterium]
MIETTTHKVPMCFEMKADFNGELLDNLPHTLSNMEKVDRLVNPYVDDILKLITRERECAEWAQWHQGATPKEHREMMDRQRMIEREEKREERRDKETREWQEAQEKKAQGFQWKATMRGAVIGALIAGIFSLFAPWYQATVTKPPVVNNIIQLPLQPTPTPIPTFTPTPLPASQ